MSRDNRSRNSNRNDRNQGHNDKPRDESQGLSVGERFKDAELYSGRIARDLINRFNLGPEELNNGSAHDFGVRNLPKVRRMLSDVPGDDCGILAWVARDASNDRFTPLAAITNEPLKLGVGAEMLRELAVRTVTAKMYDFMCHDAGIKPVVVKSATPALRSVPSPAASIG